MLRRQSGPRGLSRLVRDGDVLHVGERTYTIRLYPRAVHLVFEGTAWEAVEHGGPCRVSDELTVWVSECPTGQRAKLWMSAPRSVEIEHIPRQESDDARA